AGAAAPGVRDRPRSRGRQSPRRFLISLAVLTLLTDVASQQAILCMLDDAHWADEPSLDVIRFVARRVASEPTAFLVAVREGEGRDLNAPGMPVLDLAGLEPADAAAVLDEEWGHKTRPCRTGCARPRGQRQPARATRGPPHSV